MVKKKKLDAFEQVCCRYLLKVQKFTKELNDQAARDESLVTALKGQLFSKLNEYISGMQQENVKETARVQEITKIRVQEITNHSRNRG